LAVITSDAMADTAPLWKLVRQEVDQTMLDAIAAEYPKGRLLLVATTDLDARQAVLWNLRISSAGSTVSVSGRSGTRRARPVG
jgi:hypothetical protein